MDDEQKPDPFTSETSSIPSQGNIHKCKVAYLKRINENLSFKEWMDKRKTPRLAHPPGFPPMKVQPFLRLPTSSPAPLTQTGLLMIKDEPWEGPTQLPSTNKFQTPSNEMRLMLPNSSGNPKLHSKSPSLRPSSRPNPNPTIKNHQDQGLKFLPKTGTPSNEMKLMLLNSSGNPNLQSKSPNPNPTIQNHHDQGLKFLPKTGTPTRPRSFLKRKAPQKRLHSSNQIMMKKSAENLLCHLCQVSCSSALTMKQHVVGRSHKAKMKYMKMKRDGPTAGGSWDETPICELCEIWCSDKAALDMHFKGQKHKSKVRESQLWGGEKPSKAPIICEVCSVPCMNQQLFEMHLKGRQHATKEGIKRIGF